MNRIDGIHVSVIGSTHIKTNIGCQDNSSHYCSEEFGIAVVSDGHGSEKHFRSAKGAEFASIVAIDAIKELMMYEQNFSMNKDKLLLHLEKNIIFKWNIAVRDHYCDNPFTLEEINKLSFVDKANLESNIEVAYGSTLIAAVLTKNYCFGIQIGDGDCTIFDNLGNVINPIPTDKRLQFNITTSLCDKEALKNFRHFWNDKPAVAILVSTDGVRNSFKNETFYFDFCKTVIESLNEMINIEAENELEKFLRRLTVSGSGDDVSISTIYYKQNIEDKIENDIKIDIANTAQNSDMVSHM